MYYYLKNKAESKDPAFLLLMIYKFNIKHL